MMTSSKNNIDSVFCVLRKIAQVHLQRGGRDSGDSRRQETDTVSPVMSRVTCHVSRVCHVVMLQDVGSSVAPVDLLTCSFLHCPSPSSSVDTLTTSRQQTSQFSFGHTAPHGADDSFHNLTSVSSVAGCEHEMASMSTSCGKHVVLSAKRDPDTDDSYGVRLTRVTPHSNGLYPRDR